MAIEKLGHYSAASVKKHTGKDWDYWVGHLEKDGARNLTHQQLVAHLKKKYKLRTWWQQSVAAGYQIYIGKRIVGQNLKGLYTLTVTRTLNCSVPSAWKFLTSSQGLSVWLKPMSDLQIKKGAQFEVEGGIFGEIRTFKKPRQIRFYWFNEDWPKKTVLLLYLASRPKNKCMIVLGHEDLPSARAKHQMREHWKQAIVEIGDVINKA